MLALLQKHKDSRWILQHLSQDASAEEAGEQLLEVAVAEAGFSNGRAVKLVYVTNLDALATLMYEDS